MRGKEVKESAPAIWYPVRFSQVYHNSSGFPLSREQSGQLFLFHCFTDFLRPCTSASVLRLPIPRTPCGVRPGDCYATPLTVFDISIHAPRGGCDSKSAQNPLCLLRQNQERSFDKRENRLKGRPFDGENPHKPMIFFRILPFAGSWKVRTSRGFPGSFTFAQAENILHSPCYTIKTSLGR